jgi:hypothetical protein
VNDGQQAPDRLTELRTSARGWHGVQLAVLGFIGLCGVLQGDSGSQLPRWLQVLAGLLVLLALFLACAATALVAVAAWPVYGSAARTPAAEPDEEEIRRTGRRLRAGIALTFLAVTVLALGGTASWWPTGGTGGGVVEVTTGGGVVCGTLRDGREGLLGLEAGGRMVLVPLADVQQVRPLGACP